MTSQKDKRKSDLLRVPNLSSAEIWQPARTVLLVRITDED